MSYLITNVQRLTGVITEAVVTTAPTFVAVYDEVRPATGGRELLQVHGELGTNAVTIIDTPARGLQRNMHNLTVYNRDTVAHTITIRDTDGEEVYNIWTATLQPGESWDMEPSFSVILDKPSQSLVLQLAATPAAPCVFAAEYQQGRQEFASSLQAFGALSNTTAVIAIAAPAAGFVRGLTNLIINNPNNATVTATISLQDGNALRPLRTVTIPARSHWEQAAIRYTATEPGAGENPFDQDLNTSDDVQFDAITANTVTADTITGAHQAADGTDGATKTTGGLVIKNGLVVSGTIDAGGNYWTRDDNGNLKPVAR